MEKGEIPNEHESCGPAVIHGLVYSSDNRLPTVCMFEWEPEDDEDFRMLSSHCAKVPPRDKDHSSIVESSSEDQGETRKCHEQLTDESKPGFTFPLLDCFFDLPCCVRY